MRTRILTTGNIGVTGEELGGSCVFLGVEFFIQAIEIRSSFTIIRNFVAHDQTARMLLPRQKRFKAIFVDLSHLPLLRCLKMK